jgi:transcriptional regulator GlxA family with amidase domain
MAVRLLDADRIGPIGVYIYNTINRIRARPKDPGHQPMSIASAPGAKTQANSEYAQRIDRVIDYLRGNLDRPVKLAELAKDFRRSP